MTSAALPEAASKHRLTEALRRAGALGAGHVGAVQILSSAVKARSHTLRLSLTYEGPSAGAPASVFLKAGHPDRAGQPSYPNRREVAFYRDVAAMLPPGLVPRCHDAVAVTETDPWCLLLEDLGVTHAVAAEHPLPPARATCRRIVRRWARLHASLWDDPRLGALAGRPAAEAWSTFLRRSADRYGTFVDRHGDLLSAPRRQVYERLLGDGPRLLRRLAPGRPLTLVHGDAHWWNCLVPRDGCGEDVRLVDWEDWTVGVGAADLATMVAMLWFPDRRRELEQPLLDGYHEALLEGGVTGYGRQALGEDYRWSVLLGVLRPVWQATAGLPARVWWPNLERNFMAVEDLGCRDLVD